MSLSRRWIVLLLVILLLLASAQNASAQSSIDLELSATYKFGEQIAFTARTKSPVQIANASIVIYDNTFGITYTEPVSFNADGLSEFRFDTRQNSLRPFATILWLYELTFVDGSKAQSQTASIRYDDDRFSWQVRDGNGFRIHWYNGSDDFSTSALNAGSGGIQKIAEFFTPDLSNPVNVFIYANENDLLGALNGGSNAGVAGHADSSAGVVTVTIEAGADESA